MKMKPFSVVAIVSIIISVFLLFSRVDSAMEIDSLKEHIKLQRKEMQFLADIINSPTTLSCKNSVVDFESLVRAKGYHLTWQGDNGLVGGFEVKKSGDCVVSIKIPGWL